MTWADWLSSDYNIGGYTASYLLSADGEVRYAANIIVDGVTTVDTIIADYGYTHTTLT